MRFPLLLLALLCAVLAPPPAPAAEHPLLLPGKHSLYQRVLTRPGARLHKSPGDGEGRPVTPFSTFYVYARQDGWLQVGPDSHGTRSGWLAAGDAIEWDQGLTLSFDDPTGHDRVLLFRDRASLQAVIDDKSGERYRQLYAAAVAGRLGPDSPVVAIQPARYVDILKEFYLVPIHHAEDTWLGSEQARMLEISSVPLPPPATREAAAGADRPADTAAAGLRNGIVFVIDSTLSMQPYIERTREAVRKLFHRLRNDRNLGQVRFGLVAFRDNTEAVPALGFTARKFVDLAEGTDPQRFLSAVDGLEAARVSSRDFIEDPYAGLRLAIEDMDWSSVTGRYIILITDAGAREGSDPLSTSHLSTRTLRKLAHDKGIAIAILHLRTPRGRANHAAAERQYRALSLVPGVGELYYGVPAGDVRAFGRVLDALASQISEQVRLAGAGRATRPAGSKEKTARQEDAQLAALQARIERLGYALRMQYLQRGKDGRVPAVFRAWVVDRDFRDPARRTMTVRVLLTRDQLSDLYESMSRVLQTFEDGLLSPQDFLDRIKGLAAMVSRDPARLKELGDSADLAGLGLVQEYIEGLPYQSQVMHLSLEDWSSWPAERQIAFVHDLEDKLAYYQAVHDHADLWVTPGGGPVGGNSVFPIELDMLP